ncbi:uncharacterized protein LOC132746874 [Ruditapes philippinarum]|uniref:uncharacterized protein LOC132746874 n=1 Tax=Ruditapes philippinarum TaxID=129788 RepID=UPI00295ADB80|nr:uncharacterized protein LOC132746874 [Ruditapes philippinarum]
MRSHNVLDVQPRSILTKYGIVPDYYDSRDHFDRGEATRLVKEKLDSQDAKPQIDISRKMYSEETQNAKVRPFLTHGKSIFNIVSDIGNTSDMDSGDSMDNNNKSIISSISKSFNGTSKHDTDEPHQTFTEEDYIPLERKPVVESKTAPVIKKKRLKQKRKSKLQTHIDIKQDSTLAKIQDNVKVLGQFQAKITVEISGQSGKFQVRKDNDHWEISTISGEWSNLPEDSNREMEDVYCKVIEIKDKVDGQMKEQKL